MFIDFKTHFEPFLVFSTQDISKWDPSFDRRRLVEWQKKGYIQRIVNRWYIFTKPLTQEELLLISNRIYSPSYVSLQWALSHYGYIPEGVYTITAVSSLKTHHHTSTVASFSYGHLKPSLLFGYRLIPFQGNHIYKLAEPEKAILDFFYLHAGTRTMEDLQGMRLNARELQSLDRKRLADYLSLFENKSLENRIALLTQYIDHA